MGAGNDPFTKILLHMDGSNGGTTFTDDNVGGSAHTWTANSATTNTGTVKFGTASANFGSTGWIDAPDSADFTVGSGDFTCDFWFYVSGGSGAIRVACGQINSSGTASTASFRVGLNASNVVDFTCFVGSTPTTVTGSTAITTTGWHHVAATRSGNTLRMFLDGTQEGGNVSISGTVNDSSNKFAVGRFGELTTLTWNGFVDEFRLSVGVARWTANFTPPTAAYDLGVDAAAGAFAETGVAALFAIVAPESAGSFLETGNDAIFKPSMLSAAGSFAETGFAALFSLVLPAASTSYAVTGNPAFLNPKMNASSASYAFTINDASFVSNYRRPLFIRGSSYWKGSA